MKRIILASSQPGDVVLDPFVGSGTTAAVAKNLHRHWIGIDNDALYVQAARARVETVQPLDPHDPLLQMTSKKSTERVPFNVLLERGYLHPGQTLYLKPSGQQAKILEDGQLQANGYVGSIHRLGAQLKNVPSCNGWTQWLYVDAETGQQKPIDVLRKLVRQNKEE